MMKDAAGVGTIRVVVCEDCRLPSPWLLQLRCNEGRLHPLFCLETLPDGEWRSEKRSIKPTENGAVQGKTIQNQC